MSRSRFRNSPEGLVDSEAEHRIRQALTCSGPASSLSGFGI